MHGSVSFTGFLVFTFVGISANALFAQDSQAKDPQADHRLIESPPKQNEQDEQDKQNEQDEEFSGPQVGETLPEFPLVSATMPDGGEVRLPSNKDKPLVLVFVHEVTRPAFGLIRTVDLYSGSQREHFDTAMVLLTDDMTETRRWARSAVGSLPAMLLAMSPEGREGNGALGLNRKMTLTVLVVKNGKVTANFALVQPSDQSDAPKICKAMAEAAGIEPPTDEAIARLRGPERRPMASEEVNLRPLLAPVIRKESTEQEIEEAAKKVVAQAEANPAFRRRLGQACKAIVDGGVLENYGNQYSQTWLKQWAENYHGQ